MNKRILLQVILLVFVGYFSKAQCPIGTEASIQNVQNNSGTCTFDLEVFFQNGTANNASIMFEIYSDGSLVHTSNCFGGLKIADGPFTEVITNIQAPCSSEITVRFEGWSSPSCGAAGTGCAPDPSNNEVPLLNALPVDLISFVGNTNSYDQIKLEWVTASEESNKVFIIEHSNDARVFEEIGVLNGNGNSTSQNYYSFLDKFPAKGENYYRLKQIDFDESFEYSQLISVKMEMDLSSSIIIAPSIAESEVSLIFRDMPKENATIEIFNSNGINIHNAFLAEGSHVLDLDLSDYLPGMYFIRVPIGKEFVVKRFIKLVD